MSEEQMAMFAATGRIGPYEKEYLHKDGSRSWMLFAGRDLDDGTIAEYCIGASRVGYAEAQPHGDTVVVTRSYAHGVPGMEGRYRYDDDGPDLMRQLRAGHAVVRGDVTADPALSDAEKEAPAAVQIGAAVNVPLVKGGRLVAILFLHHRAAHRYAPLELTLLAEVAAGTWDAVERARVEKVLRDSEQRLAQTLAAGVELCTVAG